MTYSSTPGGVLSGTTGNISDLVILDDIFIAKQNKLFVCETISFDDPGLHRGLIVAGKNRVILLQFVGFKELFSISNLHIEQRIAQRE